MQIIIPTDFSSAALTAVRYAVTVFGVEDVQYTLLNCYSIPHTGTTMLISVNDILKVESEEGLENQKNQIVLAYPLLENILSTRSEHGTLDVVLKKLNRSMKPNLIVMGTKGANGLLKILKSTNTAMVMKRVKVPILVVPEGTDIRPPKSLALALESQRIPEFRYPDLMVDLVNKYRPDVSIVSVDPDSEVKSTQLVLSSDSSITPSAQTVTHYTIHEEDPVFGILEFVGLKATDFLVMIAREYGFMRNILHSSGTREMAMISKIPLLVLREEQ